MHAGKNKKLEKCCDQNNGSEVRKVLLFIEKFSVSDSHTSFQKGGRNFQSFVIKIKDIKLQKEQFNCSHKQCFPQEKNTVHVV